MRRYVAALVVLVVLILAGLYASGWMKFHSNDRTATIEIKTGEIKDAAKDAGDKAQKIVEDAAKTIREPAPAPTPSESR